MRIGDFEFHKPLALAPMESVTDPPFRLICRHFGADITYTEFASSEALIRDVKKTRRKLLISDADRPIAVQIYGSAEESMERAAAIAEEACPDFIDINCGCWVKKIAMRGDGAGLLRDLKKFEQVVQAVMRGTRLPVTVKTRLGWDENSICILDVARMLEQNGVQVLTVHCRTRMQGYKGEADWAWLEKIKNAVSLPLIGNGDVKSADDAKRMFETGCDGIMIGRAAIQNAWVFAQIRHYLATGSHLPEPTLRERVDLCLEHLRAEAEYKGERKAVLEHRKHYAGYLKNTRCIARLRAELMQFLEVKPIEERLYGYLEEYEREEAGLPEFVSAE